MTDITEYETKPTSEVRDLIASHLEVNNDSLDDIPTISGQFIKWRKVSVQAAIEAFITESEGACVYGIRKSLGPMAPTFSELLITPDQQLGPVSYVNLADGFQSQHPCINVGLVTGYWKREPIVVWLHDLFEDFGFNPRYFVAEVCCQSMESINDFLDMLRRRVSEYDPYRGKSLRLQLDLAGDIDTVHFEAKPEVKRNDVILPPGVLDSIEDHAIEVGKQAERLRAAGQHLKRGLLLYGPPGTGKTHVIRYLTSQMPEATLFVLSGSELSKIKKISSILAELTPAIVVFEDVDLIAQDREETSEGGSTLFNLLDAMEGVAEDMDVLFICTTNRLEVMEPAIASRPGRIDQAVELALPDANCRNELLRLYSSGLRLNVQDPDSVVDRTSGVTSSFIKELMRRAALNALGESGDPDDSDAPITISDMHLSKSLDIMLDPDQPLTKSLLGVHEPVDSGNMKRSKTRGVGTSWCGI